MYYTYVYERDPHATNDSACKYARSDHLIERNHPSGRTRGLGVKPVPNKQQGLPFIELVAGVCGTAHPSSTLQ
jgi:hypothetical protein